MAYLRKRCGACRKSHPVSYFGLDSHSPDRLAYVCRRVRARRKAERRRAARPPAKGGAWLPVALAAAQRAILAAVGAGWMDTPIGDSMVTTLPPLAA